MGYITNFDPSESHVYEQAIALSGMRMEVRHHPMPAFEGLLEYKPENAQGCYSLYTHEYTYTMVEFWKAKRIIESFLK